MQIADGIDFIQRGWSNANMVVLRGDGATVVIDPGHYLYGAQCLALLDGLGVAPENITDILFTHSHWDHYSFADELRTLSGAPISTGALTAQWLETKALREMWLSYFEVEAPLFSADKTIAPYQHLKLANRTWQAIPLPGHAPDILGYWQADERVLISADSLVPFGDCGVLNIAVHGDNVVRDALASVDRIEALNPKIILPGHGAVITDVAANIERLRKRLEGFSAEPHRLINHFFRRIVTARILETDPTPLPEILQSFSQMPCTHDYAKMIQIAPSELIQATLDGLLKSRILYEKDGKIMTDIPR